MPQCEVSGCRASIENGDAFHRVNEKGVPGRWRCTKHFREMGGEPDAVTEIIELHNKGLVDREE